MNYIGDHPLNLIGKVAIVTSASSPTGAAICRSLLNSNAFVLGVDNRPAHESTKCARGSHFQFFQYPRGEQLNWNEVLGYARRMYWIDEVDFLVRVVDGNDGGGNGVPNEVVEVMEDRGEGVIVFVAGNESSETGEEVIKQTQELHSGVKGKGLQYNAVLPSRLLPDSNHTPPNEGLLEHIDNHTSKRKEGGYVIEHGREMASLVQFICSKQGWNISGTIVTGDGTCTSL